MKSYNIAIVGTFDCENYGDLMFPIIFKKQIEKRLSLNSLTLFSANTTDMPLMPEKLPVYSMDKIEQLHAEIGFDAIVFGGGDLVRFDRIFTPDDMYKPTNTYHDLMVYSALVAAKFGIPIIWNAPGVSFDFSNAESEIIKEMVDNLLDYCSTRDAASANLIKNCGVSKSVHVVPDTVFSVSDLIDSEHEFDSLCGEFDFLEKDYIVFQSMPVHSKSYICSFASALREISQNNNANVVFLPIGYVHNDDDFIEEFFSVEKDGNFYTFNRKLNLFETTAVLSNAKAFIGTSLHGNVVSNSYTVPSIGLDLENYVKFKAFFKLQGRETYCVKNAEDVISVFPDMIKKSSFAKNEQNKMLISDHFDKIAQIIKNGCTGYKDTKKMFDLCFNFFPSIRGRFEVYFDVGDGTGYSFRHRMAVLLHDMQNSIELQIIPPKGAKSMLIYPAGQYLCGVENFVCLAGDNIVELSGNYSQELSSSGNYVFFESPATLSTTLSETVDRLLIKCNVSVFADTPDLPNSVRKFMISHIKHQQAYIANIAAELKENRSLINKQKVEIKYKTRKISVDEREYKKQIDELSASYNEAIRSYLEIKNSFYWRITSFPRMITNECKKFFNKTKCYIANIKENGFAKATKDFFGKKQKIGGKLIVPHTISSERREFEENYKFANNYKVSILVPLYNTPKEFLIEMIESAQNQTYKNFELCLADGSDNKHSYVKAICNSYAASDKRIVYKHLTENKGISENTNECIKMATGEYIALFDHDDVLHPSALFECVKAICEQNADYVYTDEATFLGDDLNNITGCHFKSDYAIDTLLANNYICHFSVFRASLIEKAGCFRHEYDGSQDHDMILRLTDAAEKVVHIPKVLYFWRSHANSVAMDIYSKAYAIDAGKRAVHDFLESKGIDAVVSSSPAFPVIYKIDYKIKGTPLVSIVIPTRDSISVLKQCINSIVSLTKYSNYEIVLVDNDSADLRVSLYYDQLKTDPRFKVLSYDKPFNYSAMNNMAVNECSGEYVLLLNNDTKITKENWLEELLMYAQRSDVGAVGAKLLSPDNTVQHGGIVLGLGNYGIADNSHHGISADTLGYMGKMFYAQNVSAVTGACLMVSKQKFIEVGGFDEKLSLAFNDVDFCLKLREKGYLNIFNPFCELLHYEAKTLKLYKYEETKESILWEREYFLSKWEDIINKGDPYYNLNFSLERGYDIKNPVEN